ncbi:MAG: hypothetical protein AAB512_03880 [Patescibacteria group bacterium]
MRTSENSSSEFKVYSVNTSKILSPNKGFAVIMILALVAAAGVFLAVYLKQKPNNVLQAIQERAKEKKQEISGDKVPSLTSKSLNTPSYLVWFEKTQLSPPKGENSKYKNTIYITNEDGSNKKEVSGIDGRPSIFGAENFYVEGDNKQKTYFNSKGEKDNSFGNFLKRYKELTEVDNPPTFTQGMRYGWDSSAFSPTSDSFAYARIGDTNSEAEIVVVNVRTRNEKIFKIKNNNIELGITFHFSPDSKKLYACIDQGFYFDGPTQGIWEIDIDDSKVTSLDKIQKLGIKKCNFRYNPNTLYGSRYKSYGVVGKVEGQPVNRSRSVYKIDLDTKRVEAIDAPDFFHYFDISKTGLYAISTYQNNKDLYNYSEKRFVIDMKSGKAYSFDDYFEKTSGTAWSDSDKLAVKTYDGNKTDLYIFDPSTRHKILINSLESTSKTLSNTIELVGWIH